MKRTTLLAASVCLAAVCGAAFADDPARFDLTGPKVSVRVTRGSITLPIAEVPNLMAGDRLWVKADLPDTQSNHLLLIVAFLRGTTNEPPDDWFTEIETWDKKQREGTVVTVPKGAEQAILFIAPETGGDFKTLRSAVKGKPGLFIRADADLNEASFEQLRIQHYLAAMKQVDSTDAKVIADHSAKLAATLALKPNPDCFKKPVEEQVNCLTVASAPVLMNDGHGMGVAEALSSGPASDLANNASYTQPMGAGLYSAYVGTIVDVVHLVSLLKTAQYQYIPGLAFPEGEVLNLKLNAPPSFHNPKSVIVIALPAVQAAKLPPLKAHEADEVACLLNPKMALQLEGAPLVFSTDLAHDMVLHLNRTGAPTDLPLRADAFDGGLVVAKDEQRKPLGIVNDEQAEKHPAKVGTSSDLVITGTVEGYWGFDHFTGPTLQLQQQDGKDWKVVGDTQLLAGKDNKLTLKGDGTACVAHIALRSDEKDAKDVDVSYKPAKDDDGKFEKDTLALDVSLKKAQPGTVALGIKQYGAANDEKVSLTAYNADVKLETVKIHSGDKVAVLTGTGAKDVASVQIGGQTFTPAGDTDGGVKLEAKAAASPKNGDEAEAKLKDGRTMKVKIDAEAARPELKLVSLKATAAAQEGALPVVLDGKDEIPLRGKLTFVVATPGAFPRTQRVEVATADGAVKTQLSLADNNLVLEDEHTAVGTLDPLKAFGQSAFGPLAMRAVAADGTTGDWVRLGMLVRTPEIDAVKCAAPVATANAPTQQGAPTTCAVEGKELFLVQSFGAGKDFAKPADVPAGFADGEFQAPAPADGKTMYLKLRDDPGAVAEVKVPGGVPAAAPAPAAAAPAANPATAASPAAATSATAGPQSAPAATDTNPPPAKPAAAAAATTVTPAPK